MRTPAAPSLGLPHPRGTVRWTLIVLFGIWLLLAIAVNWVGVSEKILQPFVGLSSRVFPELWRLLTAALIHDISGDGAVSHIATTLLVVYFFGPTLEERWGARRTALFFVASATFAFACQILVGSLVSKLYQEVWFGGLGMADALAVAWALSARPGQQVRLFFVLPVTPMMLLAIILVFNLLRLIALGSHHDGLVTPFGGMLAGYLFGDASPVRRFWLQRKLERLQREAAGLKARPARAARSGGPELRVIEGGAAKEPPKDKRLLN